LSPRTHRAEVIVVDTPTRRLYRSEDERMILGVAGGIAEYLDVDPTVVRIVMAIGLLLTLGPCAPLAYFGLALIMPAEPRELW
jgi:phage shock protein C